MAKIVYSTLSDADKLKLDKLCYKAAMSCHFSGSQLEKKYKHPSPQFILNHAEIYFKTHATNEEKTRYIKLKNDYLTLKANGGIYYRDDTKSQEHINKLSTMTNGEQVDKYLKENEINFHYMKLAILDRKNAFQSEKDRMELLNKAQYALELCSKYRTNAKDELNARKKEIANKEKLQKCIGHLTDFLMSDVITSKDFCNQIGISQSQFDKDVKYVKDNDQNFYNYYQKGKDSKTQNYYTSLKPVVEDILTNIETNSDYNIIDYYLKHADNYKFSDICESCKKFNMDIKALKNFFSKCDIKSQSKDSFMEMEYYYKGEYFTNEDKEKIYQYLKDNKIPTNGQNVILILNRYYTNNNKSVIKNK